MTLVVAILGRDGMQTCVVHPAIRKIVYTTNAIESLNYQLRKVRPTSRPEMLSEKRPTLLVVAVPTRLSREEILEMSRDLLPASADDVPVTSDGVRLDTKEKVIEFFAQLARERQVGSSPVR
ncbi:MAG: hypothetical protein JJE52_15605 [Acidimicrobiia bacterium]|nr:hypothetical protein [Acidimicrobiia bacterium]